MPGKDNVLENRLSAASEIDITVTGRKSGRTVSLPIWFVFQEGKLYLLPVKGSDTQWYKNLLKIPSMCIGVRDAEAKAQAVAITDAAGVASVVEKFQEKYGSGDVRKYYSKFDVAVVAQLR